MELCENDKCELEILIFLTQLLISQIYAVGSKLLNLREVLSLEIIFYIVYVDYSDVDRQICV